MSSTSYKAAGVDIDAANSLIEKIQAGATNKKTPEVLSGIGGFSALYELPQGYQRPVLVSSTDGVGTKLKLALAHQRYHDIGIDLVAMCVNDLITCGAKPLFFLDYYATGRLDVAVANQVIQGIQQGCEQANMALVGGETAEMPGVYTPPNFDLAGFSVGVVEKDKIISPQAPQAGDQLIGLASSGPHANGFSLIRHLLAQHDKENNQALDERLEDKPLRDHLLAPTVIYVKVVQALLAEYDIHGMAHITGGGLTDNIPRMLPQSLSAVLEPGAWVRPAIFDWLQALGQLSAAEMDKTFNNGIGLVICLPAEQVADCLTRLTELGQAAWHIGSLINK